MISEWLQKTSGFIQVTVQISFSCAGIYHKEEKWLRKLA
jgi:hypothetical protein